MPHLVKTPTKIVRHMLIAASALTLMACATATPYQPASVAGGFDGFCAYVDDLNTSMGIPKTLTELGVKNPDLDLLTDAALRDPSTGGNPVEMTAANTKALFEACL